METPMRVTFCMKTRPKWRNNCSIEIIWKFFSSVTQNRKLTASNFLRYLLQYCNCYVIWTSFSFKKWLSWRLHVEKSGTLTWNILRTRRGTYKRSTVFVSFPLSLLSQTNLLAGWAFPSKTQIVSLKFVFWNFFLYVVSKEVDDQLGNQWICPIQVI